VHERAAELDAAFPVEARLVYLQLRVARRLAGSGHTVRIPTSTTATAAAAMVGTTAATAATAATAHWLAKEPSPLVERD
jgi:hypothetical protein